MPARAMWKAELAVGSHAIPVKLYAAVADRAVRFRLLDERSAAPVQQQLVAADDEPIAPEETRRGIDLGEGLYAVVTPAELEALVPPESRTIALERFVPPAAIAEAWYDRPYWLGPDGDLAAYSALLAALQQSGLIGVARWTMRKHRYHGALLPKSDHLALVRLRNAEEVVPTSSLAAPEGRAASAKELALAEQLVVALEGPFEPAELEGTYEERVRELIAAKAEGKVVKLAAPHKRAATTGSLEDALAASLRAVGGKRHGA